MEEVAAVARATTGPGGTIHLRSVDEMSHMWIGRTFFEQEDFERLADLTVEPL